MLGRALAGKTKSRIQYSPQHWTWGAGGWEALWILNSFYSCYAPIPDKGCNVSKFIMRHALKDFASDCNHSLLLVGYRNWNGWASLHAPLCMRTHLNRHTKHCGTWALDVSVRGCVATAAHRNALLDPLCGVSQEDLAQWQTLPKKKIQTSTVMACNMLRDFLEEVHHC